MGKPHYNHYPRSIIQSRKDHPSTLTVTVPKKIVQAMLLKQGDIVEFVTVTEGLESYCKVRKV
ncbi:MAG TPA: AbrB/MazE/SpoVT family DNA-binding domain-containing protein [Nitrososphaera sp.]|nr:AbrB/MazE/SpoVT family DNA-binding domain-containing protein [Nitrososphaera sp.]